MGAKQDKTSQFVSEMSERQISVREFFSTVLLDFLKRDFGLEKSIIMMFDPEGNFLSWITENGIEIAGGSHPYTDAFEKDPVRRLIYEEAVRDQLTYFNLVPRIYRATDYFETEELYDKSDLARFARNCFDSYYGYLCSMSRKGDCRDNAPMECFWGKLKEEWLKEKYDTIAEAKHDIYEYFWSFYPNERPHQSNGYLTPEEYCRS